MATAYEKFQKRLVLAAYFRDLFGARRPGDPQAIPTFHEDLRDVREGWPASGVSHLVSALQANSRVDDDLSEALVGYDRNVHEHTQKINAGRTEAITWKYFQHLAALMTEHYLSLMATDPAKLVSGVNAFASRWNQERTYIKYPTLDEEEDLGKLAYWMATGSGKTLLMHLNYYQYRHHFAGEIDHHVLVTPNEGLTEQHMDALRKSGIECVYYDRLRSGGFDVNPKAVKVLEISKLALDKTGEGMRVDVSAFEGQNLVFVDEGHKGAAGETWRTLRQRLAGPEGFTFEYSATFGQAVGSSTPASVEEEYGKAILLDYSYQRFYDDGYGKDYQILNLSDDAAARIEVDGDTNAGPSRARKHYLLANLLAFYEQKYAFAMREDELRDAYHLEAPLLTFVGHSVTGGHTKSDLGTNDKRSVTDIQRLVRFLHSILQNENGWVPAAIDEILAGDPALTVNGRDLFEGHFELLKERGLGGHAILERMQEEVFHAAPGPTGLHLVDLDADGEIGLRAGSADDFFGVIDVGNDRGFLQLTEQDFPDIRVRSSDFEGSLFKRINERGSQVNVLLGARKFIEGWSSWRVSTMGLMNIGRGEGPQIIQLFGRGVRLKGRGRSLKRSSELPDTGGLPPQHLQVLETLHVFGVRAKYMAAFRDYLEKEDIDTEERQRVRFKTRLRDPFPEGENLQTIQQDTSERYEDAERLKLSIDDTDNDTHPVVDLTTQIEALSPNDADENEALPSARGEDEKSRTIDPALIPLLDWPRLHQAAWRYRTSAGYTNLTFDEADLRDIITKGCYKLYCPKHMIQCQSYQDLGRVESIVLRILRTYITDFYTSRKQRWERSRLRYTDLTGEDDNLVGIVEARVKRSKNAFMDALMERLQRVDETEELLYEGDDTFYQEEDEGQPPRVVFDPHLYQPLVIQYEEHEDTVKYSPPGLNEGEEQFVRDLRAFLDSSEAEAVLGERSLYLLRNQTRGRGVGFQKRGGGRFFPDFILWLAGENEQHIVFIDPHGLDLAPGNIKVDPNVRFCRSIDTLDASLRKASGRSDVHLDAYIVSTSKLEVIRKKQGMTRRELNGCKVYFQNQKGYVDAMLRTAVEG